MGKVVLASSSPRRRELLKDIFEDFSVVSPQGEEKYSCKRWGEIVKELSRLKARSVEKDYPDDLIIAADTIVVCGGKILGKPTDTNDALQMLETLSGNTHTVYSGVSLLQRGVCDSFYDKAQVTFRKLSGSEIENYVLKFKPLDKAGAYGIQETDFAKKVKGSFSCVVGLPMEILKEKLKKRGQEE